MAAHAPFLGLGLAQLALVTFAFLSHPAAGEKYQRLCRFDVREQQCVDIGSRVRHTHRRTKVTPKQGVAQKNRKFNTSASSIKTDLGDFKVSATLDQLNNVSAGKCNAQYGMCDIRELDMKLKCRCWDTSGDVISTGERLCRTKSGTCIDVSSKRKLRKGRRRGRKRKNKGQRKRGRKEGQLDKERKGRKRNRGRKEKDNRKLRNRHRNSGGNEAWDTGRGRTEKVQRTCRHIIERKGRCASKGGECKKIERNIKRKCECDIPINIQH